MACGSRVFEFEVAVVKEEPPDEQWIKAEVDIEEHELLQHPRVRAALPHLALPALAERQHSPAASSISTGTEALPDTRQAAPEGDIKLEPESLPVKGCNEVPVTEKGASVTGRWFNSRVVLWDCGAALRHSNCFCMQCRRLCASRSALLRHQQAHCAPECDDAPRPPEGAGDKVARRYECDICHYTCKAMRNMVNHMRTHTGEKPYKCNLCNYRSATGSRLSDHKMRSHTGKKPFKCILCEYRSGTRRCLTDHMRIHTGEKPFKCNVCEYRCSQKKYLSGHMITHMREKPFKCNLCEYRCGRRRCLTEHLLTHTGEKPFMCNLCDYSSVRRRHLTRHLRTQHSR